MNKEKIEENVPYCLGRLFAVLEKVRGEDFLDKLHHNVIQTPAFVFAYWLKALKSKISENEEYSRLVSEILDCVEKIPKSLVGKGEGDFQLGYQHQRALLQKSEKSESIGVKHGKRITC